jgi:hypothetical protein
MQQASERLIRSAPNRLELDLKLASETTQAYAKAALAELAREFYETADKVERRAKNTSRNPRLCSSSHVLEANVLEEPQRAGGF